MIRRPTKPPALAKDGRCRVNVSLSVPEAEEVARAADGQTVSEFARWAVLRAARTVNSTGSEG